MLNGEGDLDMMVDADVNARTAGERAWFIGWKYVGGVDNERNSADV